MTVGITRNYIDTLAPGGDFRWGACALNDTEMGIGAFPRSRERTPKKCVKSFNIDKVLRVCQYARLLVRCQPQEKVVTRHWVAVASSREQQAEGYVW